MQEGQDFRPPHSTVLKYSLCWRCLAMILCFPLKRKDAAPDLRRCVKFLPFALFALLAFDSQVSLASLLASLLVRVSIIHARCLLCCALLARSVG